jgi:hypothetical protein
MEISRLTTSPLRNEEWFRFHTEFSGVATICGIDILQIERINPFYETFYKEADELFELLHKTFITASTTAADKQRGRIFRGLRDSAKSNLYAPDAERREADMKVNTVIQIL